MFEPYRVIAFDRDGVLEPFGGPVPFALIKEIQGQGHKVGAGGGASPEEQRAQWLSHGVEPDFALSKGDLEKLTEMYPGEEIIQVDDDPGQAALARAAGRLFMTPAEFLGALGSLKNVREEKGASPAKPPSLVMGYHQALAELGQQDIGGIADLLAGAREVLVVGNGGSAATASHFASDLMRAGARARSLCDNAAVITGLANDLGYEHVFARQTAEIGRDDALVVISGSGNSANLIHATRLAKSRGAATVAFLGFGGGELGKIAERCITLSSRDYGEVEGVHSCLCHIIARQVRERLWGK